MDGGLYASRVSLAIAVMKFHPRKKPSLQFGMSTKHCILQHCTVGVWFG